MTVSDYALDEGLAEQPAWPPDAPIDHSIPDRSRQRGSSRHFGFFPYPARKPWSVVQEYIHHYAPRGGVVCDPFVGSGVTAVESLILRRRVIASDINPIARFITYTKAISPIDLASLHQAFEQVQRRAQHSIEALDSQEGEALTSILDTLKYPTDPIPSTVDRSNVHTVDRLHTPRQLAGLTILRDAIDEESDAINRDMLRVALAGTIRYTNLTYAGRGSESTGSPYRGNANFLRRFNFSLASKELFYEHRVWPSFQRAFNSVAKAKRETNRLIGTYYNSDTFDLVDAPAARIHEVTGEGQVHYVFADPPYHNDIYFVDLSVLWAAWLGLPITDEIRANELIVGGTRDKTSAEWEREFAAAMEAIARALRVDHWFTLVYKHKDLGLWQFVKSACEGAGLRYENAVWQDVKIRSTRQIESPDINPTGDMYLNFRKVSGMRAIADRRSELIVDLPTKENYVEHEVERLIVSYLGADIQLLFASVMQRLLNSSAFREYGDDPGIARKDLLNVLRGPRFDVWEPESGGDFWVLRDEVYPDGSLPAIDRARYLVFAYLRAHGEATEGQVSQRLLTVFAQQPEGDRLGRDIVPRLLRHMAVPVKPRRWRFDPGRVTRFKELRLLFERSRADEIRERLEQRAARQQPSLQPNLEGIQLLLDRMDEANEDNRQYEKERSVLLAVLQTVLDRLASGFHERVEAVAAVGDWAAYGVDLRDIADEDVVMEIVLRDDQRPYSLYSKMADEVFSDLDDGEILLQFRIETLSAWRRRQELAQLRGQTETSAILLLDRK